MEKKSVLVKWDKEIFDGKIRSLPDGNKIYSQIYDIPSEGESWSVVFEFKEPPRIQGYVSRGTVHFLTVLAPANILSSGFKFDFLDGAKIVGVCEIIDEF